MKGEGEGAARGAAAARARVPACLCLPVCLRWGLTLPRHLTVTVLPTGMVDRSTSTEDRASTSALAERVLTTLITVRRAAVAYRKRAPPSTK